MGEQLALLQPAVGRQVQLAMHGLQRAVLQNRQGVVVLPRTGLLDKAHYQLHVARGTREHQQARVMRRKGQINDPATHAIPRQRQLREDQQVQIDIPRLMDDVEMTFQVGLNIAEAGVNLGRANAQVILMVHGQVSIMKREGNEQQKPGAGSESGRKPSERPGSMPMRIKRRAECQPRPPCSSRCAQKRQQLGDRP